MIVSTILAVVVTAATGSHFQKQLFLPYFVATLTLGYYWRHVQVMVGPVAHYYLIIAALYVRPGFVYTPLAFIVHSLWEERDLPRRSLFGLLVAPAATLCYALANGYSTDWASMTCIYLFSCFLYLSNKQIL